MSYTFTKLAVWGIAVYAFPAIAIPVFGASLVISIAIGVDTHLNRRNERNDNDE